MRSPVPPTFITDHHVPSVNQSLLSGFEPVGDDGLPAKEGPWYWPAGATSAAPAEATSRPRRVATAMRATPARRTPVGKRWNTQRTPVEREDSDTCGQGIVPRGVVACKAAGTPGRRGSPKPPPRVARSGRSGQTA